MKLKLAIIGTLLSSTSLLGRIAATNVTFQVSPDISWIKKEVKQIFENKRSIHGEILDEIISIDWNRINANSIVIALGQFTNKNKKQFIITIPGSSKTDINLGWETNIWLLVEQDSVSNFKTINSIRGDIAYQNSVCDMNADGFDEISMVNKTQSKNIQKIAYKIFSFNSSSLLYVSETEDRWNTNKEFARKDLKKGDLLYNILENQYIDIDDDGKLEIVEKWIEFRYNGGKRINEIEQKKTMKIRSRILTLKDGIYQ